jgi:hypothetical protein
MNFKNTEGTNMVAFLRLVYMELPNVRKEKALEFF